MGRRAAVARLRIDARRPASWLALAVAAGGVCWLATVAADWWPAAALAAGGAATAVAVGSQRAGEPGAAVAWSAARVVWPVAGACVGWLAMGPPGAEPATVVAVAAVATAAAIAGAALAGSPPAAATSTGLAAAAVAAACRTSPWAPVAAACGGWAAAVVVAIAVARQSPPHGPRPRWPPGEAVPRAVMPSALVGMVTCLFLVPHAAWIYVGLAGGWLLVSALPRAALGAGADGEAARRRLAAVAPGRWSRPPAAAARLVAAYAAVLAWPPLVAAVLSGTPEAAIERVAIAATIAGAAAALAGAVAAAIAAEADGETVLAVAVTLALVAVAGGVSAGVSACLSAGDGPLPPLGLMLSNPADPATLPEPWEDPRPRQSPQGAAPCPDQPSPASARRCMPSRCSLPSGRPRPWPARRVSRRAKRSFRTRPGPG